MSQEKYRLRCEKVLNESWAILQKHDKLLKKALMRKRGKMPQEEKLILLMSSRVSYMQLMFDKAEDEECGINIECFEDLRDLKVE